MATETKQKTTEIRDLSPGEVLSEVQYYTVKSVKSNGGVVVVNNQSGSEFGIARSVVEEGLYSASQFVHVSKMGSIKELVQEFRKVGDAAFTMSYKRPYEDDLLYDLLSLKLASSQADIDLIMLCEEISEGISDIVTGHLMDFQDVLGRSIVQDLRSEEIDNCVIVEHSKIEWFICKNVKYTLE